MYDAYYDRGRFLHVHDEMIKAGLIRCLGNSPIRKTGCFCGDKINFYIDTSDGVNEDLGINEYCGRILKVVENAKGKPFIFFKSMYSPVRSRDVVRIAEKHGGKVVPFVFWSNNPRWYPYVWGRRASLLKSQRKTAKQYDNIGLGASLQLYHYPKPNKTNGLVSRGMILNILVKDRLLARGTIR